VRVVAGAARGRRLVAPEGRATRPTSDRVREALFNALGSMDVLVGARVADLFAGSGALGIEALSRGAAHVTFVESDRAAVEVIRRNLELCGFADRARVRLDAVEREVPTLGPLDLVLADPPYAYDGWGALSAGIRARVLVVESDRAVVLSPDWEVQRSRTYGGTVLQIATRVGPEPATEPQEPAP